jgi:O-antigen/teichoic acid export membrane protein
MTGSPSSASIDLGSPDDSGDKSTPASDGHPDVNGVTVADVVVPAEPFRGGLRALVVRGSVVTMAGFGGAQMLRLVSSVVLTRLLNRDAYGLYRLANVFLEGLAYFTAIGSGPAVIRDPRGDEPIFLNTAWTMQVLRGVGLWLAACAFGIPYAWFYRQPILWFLIPVVGLTVLIDSFDAVAVHWCFRHMMLFRVTALEFLRQLTALIVTISWALMSATVWAFPAGAIMGCIVVLVLSHVALPGPKSRFQWDRECARAQYHFGKWVFASSVLEFVAKQMDVLFLAYFVDIGKIGVYGFALNLAEPLATLNMRLSRQVLYPLYSKTFRERPWELSRIFYRTRLAVDALHLPILGMAMVAGSGIVKLILYRSPAFWEAGWMFQILCIRTAMKCLFNPLSVCCTAIDALQSIASALTVRMIWVVATVPLGWHFWGLPGVVWAVAFSETPVLAILYWRLWRAHVVRFHRELLVLVLIGVGCAAGWGLAHFLP